MGRRKKIKKSQESLLTVIQCKKENLTEEKIEKKNLILFLSFKKNSGMKIDEQCNNNDTDDKGRGSKLAARENAKEKQFTSEKKIYTSIALREMEEWTTE